MRGVDFSANDGESDSSDHDHAQSVRGHHEQASKSYGRKSQVIMAEREHFSEPFRRRSQMIVLEQERHSDSFRRRSQMLNNASQSADPEQAPKQNSIEKSDAKLACEKSKDQLGAMQDSHRSVKKGRSGAARNSNRSSSKEASGAARDRRKSVRTNTSAGRHASGNAAGAAAGKHASKDSHSFGKVMDQSARKINAAVHSLYRSVPQNAKNQKSKGSKSRDRMESPYDSSQANLDGAGEKPDLSEQSELAMQFKDHSDSSSDTGSSDSDEKQVKRKRRRDSQSQDSSDEYDHTQAAMRVNDLLDALNYDARTDIMTDLSNWHASRKLEVEEALIDLNSIDLEHQHREEDTKNSLQSMLVHFEEKQFREVKVLVKCNTTLNLGARGKLKQRSRFAKKRFAGSPSNAIRSLHKSSRTSKSRTTGQSSQQRWRKMVSRGPGCDSRGNEYSSGMQRESPADDHVDEGADSGQSRLNNLQTFQEGCHEEDEGDIAEESWSDSEGEEWCESMRDVEQNTPLGVEDGLNVEEARKKLKEMQDLPQSLMSQCNSSEEPPAAQCLEALAQMQEGQMELEIRAELAKKACLISKAAVDHIMSGSKVEPEEEAVKKLIEEVRTEIFGEDGEALAAGPDPEELEEECRAMEALSAKQDKEVHNYAKSRERALKLEQDLAEHMSLTENDEEDDTHAEPNSPKLEQRDDRSGTLQRKSRVWTTDSPARNGARLTKSRTLEFGRAAATANLANSTDTVAVQTLTNAGPTVPSWQSNRQIQLLQEKITEKEGKIGKATNVRKLMRKELAVLRYCTQKAEAGLNAFLEEFDTSKFGDISDSSDSASDHDSETHPFNASAAKKGPAGRRSNSMLLVPGQKSNSGFVRQLQPDPSPCSIVVTATLPTSVTRGSSPTARTSRSRETSPMAGMSRSREASPTARTSRSREASPGSSRNVSIDGQAEQHRQSFTERVPTFSSKKYEDVDNEMKARISELQVQITRDVFNLKSEKKRQNLLKKDIQKLSKRYTGFIKKQRNAPNSLEALNKQVESYQENQCKLKLQITEITQELSRQEQILHRAQAEVTQSEEKRDEPVTTQASHSLFSGGATMSISGSKATGTSAEVGAWAGISNPTTALPVYLSTTAAEFSGAAAVQAHVPRSAGLPNLAGMEARTDVQPPLNQQSSLLKNEESKSSPQAVAHEDLVALVGLQSRNEEFKQDIKNTMKKMQQLRDVMKKGKTVDPDAIRQIVGTLADPKDAKPPPEYFHLKRQLRSRHNEVQHLRKRWWTDHKDLDVFVEKVRHTHGPSDVLDGHDPHQSFAAKEGNQEIDLEPLRRSLSKASLTRQASLTHHDLGVGAGQTAKPQAGQQKRTTQPRALGGLAAYRSVEFTSNSRYRFSTDMGFGKPQQEISSPLTGVTGKNISRMSLAKTEAEGSEDTSAVRKQYNTVRKSLVPERKFLMPDRAKSLTELLSSDT